MLNSLIEVNTELLFRDYYFCFGSLTQIVPDKSNSNTLICKLVVVHNAFRIHFLAWKYTWVNHHTLFSTLIFFYSPLKPCNSSRTIALILESQSMVSAMAMIFTLELWWRLVAKQDTPSVTTSPSSVNPTSSGVGPCPAVMVRCTLY